ncbi:LCP family protein [Ectobacillus polymachus]|uniref:LCP family glycopolymer transferase n=1 Tax=Ectobacillus polymachus TaxID=1508806 RepID=UPI003A835152
MKSKVFKWVVSIALILLIGGGVFAFTVYQKVSKTMNQIHQSLDREHSPERTQDVSAKAKKPISILLLGIDPVGVDELGTKTETYGRSDTIMLLTLNPNTKSMKTLSIPRDTYGEIVGKNENDNINRAYAFGNINMAVNTIEKYINVPIDYYVTVDTSSVKDIVNILGGIDVNNNHDFSVDGTHFPEGVVHLTGETAEAYLRDRENDPNGDFGRQERVRSVVNATIKKGADIQTLPNLEPILTAVGKDVKTNLSQDDMISMIQNYKDCRNNNEELQMLGGEGFFTGTMWHYRVKDDTKKEITNKLRQNLEIPQQ